MADPLDTPILRTAVNKPGTIYDAENTKRLFAEDWNSAGEALDNHEERIVALEETPPSGVADFTDLGDVPSSYSGQGGKFVKVKSDVSGLEFGDGSSLSKATGAEIDAGTDDAKYVTPKAIADSGIAFTSDIPSVPSKATGAEIDAGTDDAKYVTPEAIADSALTTTTELNTRTSYKKGVSVLSDGATPALDASLGDVFTLSAEGNRTIAVPTNPVSGQKIVIRHYANGAARTLALNTGAGGFRFGTDITALTETASGKTDYIGCIYNATAEKWDIVAYIKGF